VAELSACGLPSASAFLKAQAAESNLQCAKEAGFAWKFIFPELAM
jgi:hypothetical protein